MHNFLLFYSFLIKFILSPLPDMPITMRLRGWFYSLGMQSCGKNFQVSGNAIIRGLEKISCGNDVYIGPNAFVSARESIDIDSEVLIAMNVVIVDGNHGKDKKNNSYRFSRGSQAPIRIGFGSWIAANSVITAGSTIKPSSLILPCTVVRRKI